MTLATCVARGRARFLDNMLFDLRMRVRAGVEASDGAGQDVS